MTEKELAIKLRLGFHYYDYDSGSLVIKWEGLAHWHISELKKAELQTLIIVRDIPGRELYLLDRITELQSELRKLEKYEKS